MASTKRLITAALPYTNSVPHLGNIVGSHLPADIFARYCRMIGHDTILIGGTDDYGTATEIAAKQAGVTPEELCSFFYKLHKEIYEWFNISYNNFSKTSIPSHTEITHDIFTRIKKNGYITEKEIEVPYSKEDKYYLSDRFVIGTCPHCKYEKARGDQCENCGQLLDPKELIDIRSALSGSRKIKFVKRKHLFLELDKLQNKLHKWIENNHTWRPGVKSIALSWIKEGLRARDITRDLNWGVNVPLKGFEDSVFYVWFDAPIGYISSTQEKFPETWEKYWKDKETELYHFIGKDNIPFHTLFFPATLFADGRFVLPHNVVGLQYLNFERKKFSKSARHGVFCENLLKTDLSSDYWRFYLSFVIPETKDTEFLWDDFQKRINSELIGNFSNFVNRTLSFIDTRFKGVVPEGKIPKSLIKDVELQIDVILKNFETVELRSALLAILRLSDFGNKFFEENQPWKDKDPNVLFFCVNLVRKLALLLQPFIPEASEKILKILKTKENDLTGIHTYRLKNHKIRKPKILFEKIDEAKMDELKSVTSQVTDFFEKSDFEKLDIVIGKIVKAEKHPDADKLYVIDVDIGDEKRTIVSGLRDHYKLTELEGRSIAFLKNLESAKFRGVESNGMLLAACSDDNQHVILLKPEGWVGEKIFNNKQQRDAAKLISYSEFQKVKMVVSNRHVIVDGKSLQTKKGDIEIGAEDGFKVS